MSDKLDGDRLVLLLQTLSMAGTPRELDQCQRGQTDGSKKSDDRDGYSTAGLLLQNLWNQRASSQMRVDTAHSPPSAILLRRLNRQGIGRNEFIFGPTLAVPPATALASSMLRMDIRPSGMENQDFRAP
jgi:hypothetical protein